MPVIRSNPTRMLNGDTITRYVNTVGTSNTVYTFQKDQEKVKLTNKGSGTIHYTIGSKTGSLVPSERVEVQERVASVTLRADKNVQHFEIIADEAGTNSLVPSGGGLDPRVDELTASLAHMAKNVGSIEDFGGKVDGVTDNQATFTTAFNSGNDIYIYSFQKVK